jgi:hypothetical protein
MKRPKHRSGLQKEYRPDNKRTGMPLYGENVLNFLFKLIMGIFFFWIFFYPVYNKQTNMDFLTQMSYIMLFSFLSSLAALITGYVLIAALTRALKRPKKGLLDLNHFPDLSDLIYEFLAIMLNAFAMSTGLLIYLEELSMDWAQFFLYYTIAKAITRVIAYGLSKLFGKSILFSLGILVFFFAIMSISIIHLTGSGLIG